MEATIRGGRHGGGDGEWLERRTGSAVRWRRAGRVSATWRPAPAWRRSATSVPVPPSWARTTPCLILQGQVWDESDPDAGLAVLAIGGNIALLAQQVTGEAAPVRIYARRLGGHGMHVAATNVLRAAVEVGGPPLQGRPPLRAQLLNLLGDMLRDLGDLRGAEEALIEGLETWPRTGPAGGGEALRDRDEERLRSALLNNLSLVLQSRGQRRERPTRRARWSRSTTASPCRRPSSPSPSTTSAACTVRSPTLTGPSGSPTTSSTSRPRPNSAWRSRTSSRRRRSFATALPDAARDYVISLVNSAEIAVLRRDVDKARPCQRGGGAGRQRAPAHPASTPALVRSMRRRALADTGRHGDAIDLLLDPGSTKIQGTPPPDEVPERALTVLLEAASRWSATEPCSSASHARPLEVDDEMLDRALIGSSSRSARHQAARPRPPAHRGRARCVPAGREQGPARRRGALRRAALPEGGA